MNQRIDSFIPALRFNWLTDLYDPIVALTCREKKFKSLLEKQSAIKANHQVLDIGSGTGTLAIQIKKGCPSALVTGIDADKKIISIANKKADAENLNLRFIEGMAFNMPFDSNQIDRCVSSLFFHHLTAENKERTFCEAYRVLKQGGEIHIADWGEPTSILMRTLFYIVQLIDGFKTTSDNVKGCLPEMMKSAGFVDVVTEKNISTPLGTISLFSATKR
jgi:ubiquinone/menaquinone biosynthesis C-methylase UbiE